jgi:hypothetical protein
VEWTKVVEVNGTKELAALLKEMFGSEWHLHSWSAGSDDRLLVVFERRREHE